MQDLAGTLERARAKVKPKGKDGSGAGSPGGGSNDDDDATAHELGLNAEVRGVWYKLGIKTLPTSWGSTRRCVMCDMIGYSTRAQGVVRTNAERADVQQHAGIV